METEDSEEATPSTTPSDKDETTAESTETTATEMTSSLQGGLLTELSTPTSASTES